MSTATIAPLPATATAATRSAASTSSIRWALARVEGRRLLMHPLFLLGMATSIAAIALADSDAAERATMLDGDAFAMLGGAFWTFLAVFLATSRESRDGAQDFYAGQVVTARVRTEAVLLSLAFAGLAAAALIGASALVTAGLDGVVVIDPVAHQGQPLPARSYALQVGELVQGPLYIMAAGAFGVLAGAWTRHVLAAVLAAIVLFLPPLAMLPRWAFDDTLSPGFYGVIGAYGPLGWDLSRWHLVALAGLATLAAAAALARHDRGPRVALLALAGAGLVIAELVLGPQIVMCPGC